MHSCFKVNNIKCVAQFFSINDNVYYVSCRYRPNIAQNSQPSSIEIGEKRPIINYIFGQSNERILKRLFYPSTSQCDKSTSHLVNTVTFLAGKSHSYSFGTKNNFSLINDSKFKKFQSLTSF